MSTTPKVHFFRNKSKYWGIGVPAKGPDGKPTPNYGNLVVMVQGEYMFIPPGKVIHDEQGRIWPYLTETGSGSVILVRVMGKKGEEEAAKREALEAGVPDGSQMDEGGKNIPSRFQGNTAFRGPRWILEPLSGEEAAEMVKPQGYVPESSLKSLEAKLAAVASDKDALALESASLKAILKSQQEEFERMKKQLEEATAAPPSAPPEPARSSSVVRGRG